MPLKRMLLWAGLAWCVRGIEGAAQSRHAPAALAFVPLGPEITLPERVAKVTAISGTRDGRIIIADEGRQALHVLTRNFRYISTVGGVGSAPGKFQALEAVAPWGEQGFVAVERYLRRLNFFSRKEGTYRLTHTAELTFEPHDVCEWRGNHLLVLGLTAGRKIHEIDREGRILASFAPMDSTVPKMLAFDTVIEGGLYCDPASNTVILTSSSVPFVEEYRPPRVEYVWRDTLRPFRPRQMTADANGVSYKSGRAGFSSVARPAQSSGLKIFQARFVARVDGATEDTVTAYAFSAVRQAWLPVMYLSRQFSYVDDSTAVLHGTGHPSTLQLVRVKVGPLATERSGQPGRLAAHDIRASSP